MIVAIVGCGYSGLAAIRRCVENNIECVAFELAGEVGGLWVYTDKVGTDEFGIPIQTSLYNSVRTNSPKQTLDFPGLKFETKEDTCYPRHEEVRNYLNQFADHFELRKYIKFYHCVRNISKSSEKWKIIVEDLKRREQRIFYFDAVFICNGHTTKPFIPKIDGVETFRGLALHCHDYRRDQIFQNKKVLVIGNGPSGIEIAYDSSMVAEKTFLSVRTDKSQVFPNTGIIYKETVKSISQFEVTFIDESTEDIDVIVYCTGYQYYFPFLDQSCRITVEEYGQIVKPLYKHYINIEEPTMCFIGLFQRTIISYLFDLQVQAFIKFITKQIQLPSKMEMAQWLVEENKRREAEKIPRNRYYHLSKHIVEYFEDITTYANLENIPPVLFKIFRENEKTYTENYYTRRRWYFDIENDKDYISYLKPLPNDGCLRGNVVSK